MLATYEDTANHRDFKSRGEDVENHGGKKEANSLSTTVNCSGQASGLTRKVKVQVKLQKVLIDTASDSADGFLGNTGEDGVTEFLEKSGTHTGDAVWGGL